MKTPFHIYVRIVIALGSLAMYVVIFPILYPTVGAATAALTIIPMAIIGWLLGVRGSLLFGILDVPLNIFLLRSVGDPNGGIILPSLIGSFAFTLISMSIAWIRELVNRVNKQAEELREEIEKRKRAEERLSHEALHDPLTNLPNRRLFFNRLEHASAWSKRNLDNQCAVLYLDLNRFKIINDTMGHETGDQLLIQVADRLKSSVRAMDTVARMGGDEFAILLEAASTPDDVNSIIQRIQINLTLPYEWRGGAIVSGASIGVVMNIALYEQMDDILRDADTAMYRAKASGDNQFKVFNVVIQE